MPRKREGLPLYTMAKNLDTGKRELKSTTTANAIEFGNQLRNEGYAVSWIFSEADYKRAANKLTLRGSASLTPKEIHIYDTYNEIMDKE